MITRSAVGQIYLDYNASTPIDPRVAATMRPFLEGDFGNPSSTHWAGASARTVVDNARDQVAAFLGCALDEVVFTSGGSEANNLALKGVFFAHRGRRNHLITTAVEHPAILEPCRFLERLGARVTYLPVDRTGRIDTDDLRKAITPSTLLVSIMHANNEVGTIQPIEEASRITQQRGVLLHTDAAQSAGKIPIDVDRLGVDLLSLAGHKMYAPTGVGALYVRRGVHLEPLVHGAGHEGGRRAGTESALLVAAFGKAAELARDLNQMVQVRRLRDLLWELLRNALGEQIVLNGHPEHRLPNTLNVGFVGLVGSELLAAIDGVAGSTGSACHAGNVELSPVLRAMGVSPEVGMGAIRLSLGRWTTETEIRAVAERLTAAAHAMPAPPMGAGARA